MAFNNLGLLFGTIIFGVEINYTIGKRSRQSYLLMLLVVNTVCMLLMVYVGFVKVLSDAYLVAYGLVCSGGMLGFYILICDLAKETEEL